MEHTLITGSVSGLGLEFAKLYAKDNHNLILVDLNEEGLEKLNKSLLRLIAKLI